MTAIPPPYGENSTMTQLRQENYKDHLITTIKTKYVKDKKHYYVITITNGDNEQVVYSESRQNSHEEAQTNGRMALDNYLKNKEKGWI